MTNEEINNMGVEHVETYKIEETNYSLAFNVVTEQVFLKYYDEKKDEDFYLTIKDDNGFHLENSPEKDLSKLQNYFNFFMTYKEKNKC